MIKPPSAAVLSRHLHFSNVRTMAGVVKLSSRSTATSSTSGATPWNYVPGGPIYKGEVNDATPFPPSSRSEGSHHWAFERLLAASLIPLTAGAFASTGSAYPVMDGILSISLVMHSHLGFDQMLIDYVHPRKFPIIGRLGKWLLRGATLGTLVGVYQFNTNDVGLTELIKNVWTT